MPVTRTINVELGERAYPIFIGNGLLGGGFDLREHVRGSDCLVVTNTVVGPLYRDRLEAGLKGLEFAVVELPDGEAYKTLATMTTILDALVEARAGRDTTVIALGGGVVGDIAGFAAATYMRGVDFIQVPTTLLAQVDSSVGGKTGVNHPRGKNLVGAFHQPRCVLIDTDTLATLPERELSAGLAEVIKYGAIVDPGFLAWLEANMELLRARDREALAHAIGRSCELKAEVVADDEREAGRRAILNFGHTFGHAIERCQGYGAWLHGEAVAAGMIMAARLSGLPAVDVDRLGDLLRRAGLPVEPPAIPAEDMLAAMGHDKKVTGRQLRFILLDTLGSARVTSDYDAERLDDILGVAK
jgi:3-dehydroquinate synthase